MKHLLHRKVKTSVLSQIQRISKFTSRMELAPESIKQYHPLCGWKPNKKTVSNDLTKKDVSDPWNAQKVQSDKNKGSDYAQKYDYST